MRILSFSGLIPEQICDTVRFIRWQGDQTISHYCGYAADFISQVTNDSSIDGAVYPRTCDSSRSMTSYLDACSKFAHSLHIPSGQNASAIRYFAADIHLYQQAVEDYYGISITDIPERIDMINARNQAIAKLYAHLPEFSFSAYLSMLHVLLQTPLREQTIPEDLPGRHAGRKRIYLVGSLLSSSFIVEAMEQAGLSVVGDRLTESKRLFSAPQVSTQGDLYENIARSILKTPSSPSQNRFNEILREDMAEIRDKQIEGVVFITQKFCEPYDYLFSSYKQMLDEQSIPVLHLALSGSTDRRAFDASLQAFADIL